MKNKNELCFPQIKKSITDFMNDEEGNISRVKLLSIGTMVVLLSAIFSVDVFAEHGSHESHESHSSTSYIRNHTNSHNSHSNLHSSHNSHVSHGSHTSHSNTGSHSNSNYSAAGDNTTPLAPEASDISEMLIKTPVENDVFLPIPDPNVVVPVVAVPPDTPDILPNEKQ